MLEAGRAILLDHPASGAFAHLTASRVASAAGRTTGALFHQWPTLDDYLRDLLARLFDPTQSETFDAFVARVGDVMGDGGSLSQGLTAASREALDVLPHDPHSVAELLVWNRAVRDEDFRETVASLYPPLDEAGGAFIEALLALSGREMRPPYTTQTVAALASGILQGLAIRSVLTPGFYPEQAAGDIILTLIPLFTRQPGDPSDATEYVATIPVAVDD
jgi:AcrR family transcriptional regulator